MFFSFPLSTTVQPYSAVCENKTVASGFYSDAGHAAEGWQEEAWLWHDSDETASGEVSQWQCCKVQ